LAIRAVTIALAAVLLVPCGAIRLSAWGAVGHHVVARVAWALMTPEARAEATSLLDGGQDVFVAAATWADEVRNDRPQTYNWHFVDIPIDQPKYDAARDCPATEKGDCVIAEIERARAELTDASRPASLRAESLKFLIHFVGDLHQPLHAIDNHDRGGNDVKVTSLRDGPDGRATNLHAVWDTGIINLSTTTEAARANTLIDTLRAHPLDVTIDVVKWAEESHAVGLKAVYTYSGFSPAGPPQNPVTLSPDYITQAAATMDQQIMKGGARLAAVVNGLLGRKQK
jgi:nuclease S1